MELAIVYSEKLKSNSLPASSRVEAIYELSASYKVKLLKPRESDVEGYIKQIHDQTYVEKIKKHPFYEAAVENVRCVLEAVNALREFDVVIVPLTATGHLASRDKMGGYCIFNTLSLAVGELSEKWKKIAVVESDAHHGIALVSKENVKIFCLGDRKCEISEDLRCVLGREMGKEDYINSFSEMMERVEKYDPDVLIWYLGTDIDKREYAEMDIGIENFKLIAEKLANFVKGRRALIMLASGSREDVTRDFAREILFNFLS